MKKIQLDMECLDVQSFNTTPGPGTGAGTVLGHGTVGAEASCAASWCGDCQSGADPVCASDAGANCTYDCPSVNPINCQSAMLSDCCPSQNWTECCGGNQTNDPFGGECT